MGRGFSESQTWVLRKALGNYNQDRPNTPDLTYPEIKSAYFRLPLIATATDASRWRFRRTKLANYEAVSTSISRTVARLKKRGLVEVRHSRGTDWVPARAEIYLTPAGVKAAERLQARRRTPR